MTLTGQLERLAKISLPALITIGREVQTTLDQYERLASKSSQLEGEREVVADLVSRHDVGMAQNQPKLTADRLAHRMSAPHTLAAAASKKRSLQELKNQRAMGGKNSPCPHGNRPPLPLRGTASSINLAGAKDRRTAPLRTQAGAGERTRPLPPPPVSNPGTTPHLPEAAELAGARPGGAVGVRVEEGAAAVAVRCAQAAPMQASPPSTPLQLALSPRTTSTANLDTSSATVPTKINRQTTAAVPG